MEQADTIIQIPHFYGSLKGMQNKFDKYARQDAVLQLHNFFHAGGQITGLHVFPPQEVF